MENKISINLPSSTNSDINKSELVNEILVISNDKPECCDIVHKLSTSKLLASTSPSPPPSTTNDQENTNQEQIILDNNDGHDDDVDISDNNHDDDEKFQFQESFYEDAEKYWSTIAPTINGMLGGFGQISQIDISGSRGYLMDVLKMKPTPGRLWALDCGAGIGRVTKNLLLPIFQQVDVVEQCETFANTVREFVGRPLVNRIGNIYAVGLQKFTPTVGKYDVIWCQWVLGHLTDTDLMAFFQRCILGLAKNGVLIIKENITSSDCIDVDKVDSSITRPLPMLKSLIIDSGLRILRITKQHNFPSSIFPVYMITLKRAK